MRRCRRYSFKRTLNSVGFLLKYCSAPLSTSSCLACGISLNLVTRDNQQAIDLFFAICPWKPHGWLNCEDCYNANKYIQWNLDLMESLGTSQICSLNRGFVISKTSI